ncbi:MAG: 4Fe-4S dicluster domain-containing protein, partial [Proteobacteria bacterium]|nr:4Fe-4S dicluster domain-containing protein [Pseudomonadota bacterium]
MYKPNRRHFLKISALMGASSAAAIAGSSEHSGRPSEDRKAMLIDTTVCLGCRKCEWACQNAHEDVTSPLSSFDDRSVFNQTRRPDNTSLTVVNRYPRSENGSSPTYVKVQCMHCDYPSCVSACIVGAFTKRENGAVVWDTEKCIGCRYCMVACPFQIPSFEYSKAIDPEIVKCDFCVERTSTGHLPACVAMCPVEALTFGTRSEIISIARAKIRRNPDRYIDYVYGENDAGGTSCLYLAGRDFSE